MFKSHLEWTNVTKEEFDAFVASYKNGLEILNQLVRPVPYAVCFNIRGENGPEKDPVAAIELFDLLTKGKEPDEYYIRSDLHQAKGD